MVEKKKDREAGAERAGSGPTPEEAPSGDATEASSEGPLDVETLTVRARERDEFLDMLQRVRAEFSNYRKRTERDREALAERAVGEFVLRLLPVLDDFDRALAHAGESSDLESFVRGIRLIESKIYDVLKSSGVEPFEPTGERFDPAEHEAMIVEVNDALPDQTVSEVVLKGYRQNDRVLRAARVKVARNTPAGVEAETDVTGDDDVDAPPAADRDETEEENDADV